MPSLRPIRDPFSLREGEVYPSQEYMATEIVIAKPNESIMLEFIAGDKEFKLKMHYGDPDAVMHGRTLTIADFNKWIPLTAFQTISFELIEASMPCTFGLRFFVSE